MALRSESWFGGLNTFAFAHRSLMKGEGYPHDVFDDRPVIGTCNSWSELTHCNLHLRQVAEVVKRGVQESAGFPLEFPTISLGEPFIKPTAMLLRNLMAMDGVARCMPQVRLANTNPAQSSCFKHLRGGLLHPRGVLRCGCRMLCASTYVL